MHTTLLAQFNTDTWGISGPTFAVLYPVLAGAALVAALIVRRNVRAACPAGAGATPQLDPYQAAYLNDGSDLALLAGLSALRADGLLTADKRRFTRSDDGRGTGRHPLERAILHETGTPAAWSTLQKAGPVREALSDLHAELTHLGLLLTKDQRITIRRVGGWLLAVLALGIVRLVAGLSDGKPVLLLLLEIIAVIAVTVVWYKRRPLRSTAGDAALARLRTDNDHLSPSMRPSWTANGAAAAALGVGLFGAGAVWAADPAFAEEVAAKAAGGYGASGGYGGSSSGSSYGCGSSSASSCGGGSGCGGGGCGG